MRRHRARSPGVPHARTRVIAHAAVAIPILLAAGVAQGTIRNSAHDFSSGGNGGIWGSADESRICVFCHTPHNAQNVVAAPLWNRELQNNVYSLYSSATLDAPMDLRRLGPLPELPRRQHRHRRLRPGRPGRPEHDGPGGRLLPREPLR